ncbi:hypothetical protein INQ51_11320 [Maribellus sp. CM-23]|uniref:hypothetical protein n=1 Tax=Maribellus sp. CM-23 TaxID=2781026 RepID=UPI001F23C406|nr:hypothetical protein [Maribellus sp. CM-23]MCE4564899.1 hypothetical protein [Maribellus sp. CM-23]
MEIRNFIQKIFSGGNEIQVPEPVKKQFAEQFADTINIEWQRTGDLFEAVFYRNDLENIASYRKDGAFVCLKINLPLSELPLKVTETAAEHGELMNAILIECDDKREYELIIRDTELVRYFLLADEEGNVKRKEKLSF